MALGVDVFPRPLATTLAAVPPSVEMVSVLCVVGMSCGAMRLRGVSAVADSFSPRLPFTRSTRAAFMVINEACIVGGVFMPAWAMRLRSLERARIDAALSDRITSVFGMRSKKEVRRIDTGRIVAVVADEQAFRDRSSSSQDNRDSVCIRTSSLMPKAAIARSANVSRPLPAFVRTFLFNLSPKRFIERFGSNAHRGFPVLRDASKYTTIFKESRCLHLAIAILF